MLTDISGKNITSIFRVKFSLARNQLTYGLHGDIYHMTLIYSSPIPERFQDPSVGWMIDGIFPGVTRSRGKCDRSPQMRVKIKLAWSYSPISHEHSWSRA
jgi:hypothetical protein